MTVVHARFVSLMQMIERFGMARIYRVLVVASTSNRPKHAKHARRMLALARMMKGE
jgi:hypothetical protein